MKERSSSLALTARLLFWAALAFALFMATQPQPPNLIDATDKVQHMLAFGVLTLLLTVGHLRLPAWRIAVAMALFGALIELIQLLIPELGRTADIADWFADMAAVAGVLMLAGPIRWKLVEA